MKLDPSIMVWSNDPRSESFRRVYAPELVELARQEETNDCKTCDKCGGTGECYEENCPDCDGTGESNREDD